MNLAFYYRKKCRNIYDYNNILLVNQFAYGLHARTLTHAYFDLLLLSPIRLLVLLLERLAAIGRGNHIGGG